MLLLCFLWALGSLRSDLFPSLIPNLLPPIERQAVPFALLAAVAALFGVVRGAKWPLRRQLWASILVGLGLFLAPAIVSSFSSGSVSGLTLVALFSLTPVFAVVFEPYIGGDVAPRTRGGLPAALTGVVGTLCVIPAGAPNSIRAGGVFGTAILAAACVAAANCLAVRVAAELNGKSIAPLAAIAPFTAVAGMAVLSVLSGRADWSWDALAPQAAWSTVAELPGLLLLFWLMRRMSAARMTSRFVLTPLAASLIGLVLLRPSVGLRAWLGLLLMAAGAGWLLVSPDDTQESDASPLKLD
ncbi:MAG: hypothetical protein WAM85_13330 [Terracidiphilus sp.]